MQSGTNPDDLHEILNRFHAWTGNRVGRESGNGHDAGHAADGVREIPYEEAIRPFRERQAAQTGRPGGGKKPAQKVSSPEGAGTGTAGARPGSSQLPVSREEPAAIAEEKVRVEKRVVCGGADSPSPEDRATVAAGTDPAAPARMAAAPAGSATDSSAHQPVGKSRRAKAPAASHVLSAEQREPIASTGPAGLAAAAGMASCDAGTPGGPVASAPGNAGEPARAKRAAAKKASPGATPTTAAKRERPAAAGAAATKQRADAKAAGKNRVGPAKKSSGRGRKTAGCVTKAAKARPSAFRDVLAKRVGEPKAGQAAKRSDSERNVRITTRFSAAEQKRIEQCAAAAGLTVSSYLRQRVLARDGQEAAPAAVAGESLAAVATPGRKEAVAAGADPRGIFSAPPTAAAGGWLSLLRRRFLSSSARFSERA